MSPTRGFVFTPLKSEWEMLLFALHITFVFGLLSLYLTSYKISSQPHTKATKPKLHRYKNKNWPGDMMMVKNGQKMEKNDPPAAFVIFTNNRNIESCTA